MKAGRFSAIVALGSFVLLSGNAIAGDWEFEIQPYVLFTSIEGNAGIGRVTGADVDISFGDILEILDTGAMIHFEAHHTSGWGLVLDYGYMDLSDDITGPRGGVVDLKIRQGVFQAELMYRRALGKSHIDYLGGIRWWDNNLEATIDPVLLPGTANPEIAEDWVDVFVGVRLKTPIHEKWNIVLRGDAGGLGMQADFTGSALAGLQYNFNDKMGIDVQYKGTWVDYDGGTQGSPGYFGYDTVTHGPLLGFVYRF